MKQGFVKVATASPRVRLADCGYNGREAVRIAREASALGVRLLVFPELSLTGATAGDLFYSETLLASAETALRSFAKDTAELSILSVVGLPVRERNKLYNCAAVVYEGKVLALIPKTVRSGDTASSDARYFSMPEGEPVGCFSDRLASAYNTVFGTKQIFSAEALPSFSVAVVVGDGAVMTVETAFDARGGATVLCNPTATPETVGKSGERRLAVLASSQSNVAAVLLANANAGESTSDAVYAGHCLIAENGDVLSESVPFSGKELTVTEIDVERLSYERRRTPEFSDLSGDAQNEYVITKFEMPLIETALTRSVPRDPFMPVAGAEREERCCTILAIQANALAERITRAYAKKIVIGISGGLDSTLALLVGAKAMDILGRSRTDVIGITMPGFGTTGRTKGNAEQLCTALRVDLRCIPIGDAVAQHFRDIGHDPEVRDVTYENSQARERTQVLMDVSNDEGGMVIGTGDLSELVLGWATYNGDHMSMYGVNASLPKTLIRHIVGYAADEAERNGETLLSTVLRDILATPVSPELLPADESGNIAQRTEDLVGPYELHDFYIYHMLRYGCGPEKLYRLAKHALGDTYDDRNLVHWLEVMTRRFFTQQFKRSCSPEGPRVGKVALSPRGALCMPGDAVSAEWLLRIAELKKMLGL